MALIVLLIQLSLAARPVIGGPAVPSATPELVEILKARLEELGVDVKEIRLVERSPVNVDISVQGISDTDQPDEEDVWKYFLAEREAQLAYLNIGEGIDQYHLLVYNAPGKILFDHIAYLNPELPSQQLAPPGPAAIGDEETRDLILKEWNIGKNEWLSLQVESDHYARENTKYVYMEWSTGTDSFEEIKARVQAIGRNRFELEDFNARHGAQIAIVRVKVFDPNGKFLAFYIYDDDIRMEIPGMPDGVEAEWLPHPAPIEEITETPVPTPTFLPLEPSATPEPYP